MRIQLDEPRRQVVMSALIHAALEDMAVASLFVGVDFEVDDLPLTDKQAAAIRGAMPWAAAEFTRARQELDDREAARVSLAADLGNG